MGDHRFAGRVVCLIDDIKTSGATLNECAKTLKEAGAARVYALALAVRDRVIERWLATQQTHHHLKAGQWHSFCNRAHIQVLYNSDH